MCMPNINTPVENICEQSIANKRFGRSPCKNSKIQASLFFNGHDNIWYRGKGVLNTNLKSNFFQKSITKIKSSCNLRRWETRKDLESSGPLSNKFTGCMNTKGIKCGPPVTFLLYPCCLEFLQGSCRFFCTLSSTPSCLRTPLL